MLRPLSFALLLLVACDPAATFKGAVVDAHSAQSLAGATVVLRCPGGKRPEGDNVLVAATDEKGAFMIRTIGAFEPECEVEIRKDGFATTVTKLGDICPVTPKNEKCWNDFGSHYEVAVKLTPLDGEKK